MYNRTSLLYVALKCKKQERNMIQAKNNRLFIGLWLFHCSFRPNFCSVRCHSQAIFIGFIVVKWNIWNDGDYGGMLCKRKHNGYFVATRVVKGRACYKCSLNWVGQNCSPVWWDSHELVALNWTNLGPFLLMHCSLVCLQEKMCQLYPKMYIFPSIDCKCYSNRRQMTSVKFSPAVSTNFGPSPTRTRKSGIVHSHFAASISLR